MRDDSTMNTAKASSSAAIPDLKRGIALGAPPRAISRLLWLQVVFGRFHCGFGAAFSFPLLMLPILATVSPVGLVSGVFPLVGISMFIVGMRKGLRSARLLREGKLAQGTFVDQKPTNVQINKIPVMEMRFRFIDDAHRERFALARTHLTAPLRDDAEEPLLYERGDDGDAMLLDDLPGHPRIVDGKLVLADHGSLVLALFAVGFLSFTLVVGAFAAFATVVVALR